MKVNDPQLHDLAKAAGVRPCHIFFAIHFKKFMHGAEMPSLLAGLAGIEEVHCIRILDVLREHEATAITKSHKGTRLPADWSIPLPWIEYAATKRHWSPAEAKAEAEIFANYWQSRSDSGAIKLDWMKVWHNWVIRSNRPDGNYVRGKEPVDRAELLRGAIEMRERMGRGDETETREWRRELASLESNVVPFRSAG